MAFLNLKGHRKEKVWCEACDSTHIDYEGIEKISKKEVRFSTIILKFTYTKNTFRSIHRCKVCGHVTLHEVKEA